MNEFFYSPYFLTLLFFVVGVLVGVVLFAMKVSSIINDDWEFWNYPGMITSLVEENNRLRKKK